MIAEHSHLRAGEYKSLHFRWSNNLTTPVRSPTPSYQPTPTMMIFNVRLFFSSALALLAIATIAAAEPVPAEKRQGE